jgi:mRNA interferase MazF
MVVKRFEIYWVNLDPTVGNEIQKTRPGIIVSPDEMNDFLRTVLIAPITSSNRNFPTRVKCKLNGKDSFIALDHIRSVDKSRLSQRISVLSKSNSQNLCEVLQEMFAY